MMQARSLSAVAILLAALVQPAATQPAATQPVATVPAAARPAAAAEVRIGDLVLTQPWGRAAGQGGTGAGYLTIRNAGTVPDRLLSAATPLAGRVELHTHVPDGEVMRMRQVEGIDLPAGQSVTLLPGGLHLMLIGLIQPLRQGEAVLVTLIFERAGTVQASLAVQTAGARGPAQAPGALGPAPPGTPAPAH